jgi:hypothetical protein
VTRAGALACEFSDAAVFDVGRTSRTEIKTPTAARQAPGSIGVGMRWVLPQSIRVAVSGCPARANRALLSAIHSANLGRAVQGPRRPRV